MVTKKMIDKRKTKIITFSDDPVAYRREMDKHWKHLMDETKKYYGIGLLKILRNEK